jgi:hypothetical protein
MNIANALQGLKLTEWTIRGNPNMERPVPQVLYKDTPQERTQTQEEADQVVFQRIEYGVNFVGTKPTTWQELIDGEVAYEASIVKPDEYDALEEFYLKSGWTNGKLTEALNTMLGYQLQSQPIPQNLQENFTIHNQNKAKAKSGNTDFVKLPYSPKDVL